MLLLDLRNQLSLDKCNWEDVHYYGTILDTNHKILDWNRNFWRHARRWGGSAGEGRENWRGGLRCGNVPVQNNVNRFLFQKAKYIWQLFFEIEVNSGKMFTEPRSGEVNIPKATIHRDWKE